MADNSLPPVPPRRAPLIDIMRELEARPRSRRSQEFDPVAATLAERRSESRQPLPLPPTPPAASPPPQPGETQAGAGTPPPAPDLSGVYPDIRRRLPENNPYVAAAIRIAEKYDLPPSVFLSLVQRESNFNPRAVSPRGAVGLGQLMPGTAQELGVDPRDPEANLDASARYLKQQITRFGSIPIALAAYNAGPGRVAKSGNQVPNIRETQEYVSDIMRNAGMEGYEGDQRYRFAEGGLADLDEKYAEGGRVRSPAAAPVASPFDAGYIERLAARAVGAGEPVTEVRSSEGRGFAPMPRDATEALQRMAAVVRGDVEPTPEEERQISHVRGFTEGPAAIRAFHASPHRFEQFKPSEFRRASFFASTPERARIGAGSGASEMVMETSTKLPRQNLNIYEVDIDPSKIRGLHYTPEEIEWFNSLPARIKGDEEFERIWRSKPRGVDVRDWEDIYTPTQIGPREYIYSRKDVPPILSYEDAISRNRDVYGSQHSHYNLGADEKAAAEIARQRGMGGYLVNDEAGLSIGVIDPNIVNIIRRYAKGGLAALDEKYAQGGTVRAPKETTIAGQDHRLAYITPEEAALLKARGGSGRMTEYGVRSYEDGNGDGNNGGGDANDNATSNSEAASQDAAGGNAGQGAGPTGAGAGGTGEAGPGDSEGLGESNADTEDADQGKAMAAAPPGTYAGFSPISVSQAIDAYDQGRMSLGQLAANVALSSVPGVTPGVNRDAIGEITEAISVSPVGLGLGLAGLATGVPGLSTIGGLAGTALGSALGVGNVVGTPATSNLGPDATGGDLYGNYGRGLYGVPDVDNSGNGGFAKGGGVSLDQMHAKYAEGGEVYPPAGEVAEYDPDEIDRIARQIHLRFPAEEDAVYVPADDVASPSDLTMRARMLMRGQTMGLPETVGTSDGNDMFTASTSLRDMPIEGDQYGTSQRVLNTGINAVLDAERNARIGAGMLALERSGERGFTGYGPQLSAGYGPASIYGGYQAITPNMPGAKSQGSYVYGGSLNIPIDESGTEANIGGTVMSGRRGQGSGPSGTQIMGSLERPLLGGRLALELAADPSLRHKEILLGYRRAF